MAVTVKNTFIQWADAEHSEDEFEFCAGTPLKRQQSEPAPKPSSRTLLESATLDTIAESCDSLPPLGVDPNSGSGSGSEDISWEGDEIEKEEMPWGRVVTSDALEQREQWWARVETNVAALHAPITSQPIAEQAAAEEESEECEEDEEEEESDEEQEQPQTPCQFVPMQMMCPYPAFQHPMMNYYGGMADPGFTVMVRNVANKYSRDLFVKELNDTGFQGAFDFVYLPIDAQTSANKGYAFVNFISTSWASMFMNMYENRKMGQFDSDKRIAVSPAVLQGFEANYAHYSTKFINQQDEKMRPLYLREPCAQTMQAMSSGLAKPLGKKKLRRIGKSSLIDKAVQQQALSRLGYSAQTPFNGNHPNVLVGMPAQGQATAVHGVKFCTYCGAKVQSTFRFCQSCGTAVAKP